LRFYFLIIAIRCAAWIALLGTLAASNADSQSTPPAASTTQTQASVVNLLVTVRDKKGKAVTDLTRNDFSLTEDGHPQQVQSFDRAVSQPLTLGLLIDTSVNQNQSLAQERTASRTFVDQTVREDIDKAFVIHFDHEVELLQDLTASHPKLEQALDSLQVAQSSGGNSSNDQSGQGRGNRGLGQSHGGAQLYDAIYLASNELMKKQAGRKAVIILSDGIDRGSKESLERALEAAQRANTILYCVLFKNEEAAERSNWGGGFPGMGGPGMGRRGGRSPQPQENHPDPKKTLERVSSETGGRFFEASKKLPVDEIYRQIDEDMRSQYRLGYIPSRTDNAGTEYHKIQLTTREKGFTVQTRDGYYSDAGQ